MARLVIASNESWAVPLGIDDRRFVICDLSDKRKGDLAFFSALYRQMNEEGGLAALMYDLLNEDLSGWVPQQRPVNNHLRSTDLKIESMTPLQKFVFHWLDSGMLHCVERGWEEKYRQCARYSNEMRSIMFSELYAAYLEWADKFNVHKDSQSLFSRRVLGQKGKEGMLPVAERLVSKLGVHEGLMYTFPPLEDCRRHFEKHVVHGRLEWTEVPVNEHSSTYDIPPNVIGAASGHSEIHYLRRPACCTQNRRPPSQGRKVPRLRSLRIPPILERGDPHRGDTVSPLLTIQRSKDIFSLYLYKLVFFSMVRQQHRERRRKNYNSI